MGFFRSLEQTAPLHDPRLPWPLDGLAYVIMMMGPICGGATAGLLFARGLGLLAGLAVGGLIFATNAVLFDRFIERRLVRLQRPCRRPGLRIITNLIGFAWAIAVCAASVALTLWLTYEFDIINFVT